MEKTKNLSTKTVNLQIMQNISIIDCASYIGSANMLRYLISVLKYFQNEIFFSIFKIHSIMNKNMLYDEFNNIFKEII